MKKGLCISSVVVLILILGSCAGMVESAVKSAIPGTGGGVVAQAVTSGASSAVLEFQSGEILCSYGEGSMMDTDYYVAKVLTQASAATKNQAEVVYVADGKKMWVNYVVPSRKATKADFAVGNIVFYSPYFINADKIDLDEYRKSRWDLGTITSVEELYKNKVEVNGDPATIDFLRVPEIPIQ
ncbi:MAG TPA: hypothetical protein PLG43_05260 [Spirochaetia bacterium]|nr:hypothetical protein [Spirochaetia bacterium]